MLSKKSLILIIRQSQLLRDRVGYQRIFDELKVSYSVDFNGLSDTTPKIIRILTESEKDVPIEWKKCENLIVKQHRNAFDQYFKPN